MSCLTDVELQSVVDGEAGDALVAHVAQCRACEARAAECRAAVDALSAYAREASPSPAADARIRAAIAAPAREPDRAPRGATTLRPAPRRVWPAVASALATTAAIAFVVYVVMPRVGAPTTMSASEILGRSLQTMTAANGVELLEYELTVDAAIGGGVHRIEQLVDREHQARFRFANYLPDGTLQSAITQDPAAGRRSHLVRVDGRNFVFNFSGQAANFVPIPELAQAQVETVIAMMQATGDQKLTVVDAPEGKQYVIQMPPIAPRTTATMLDLHDARAVIDGRDYRVREFQASGTLLKQPWSISFHLLRRTIRDASAVAAGEFGLPSSPDDIVIAGRATPDPIGDVVGAALHELAEAHGR